MTTDEIIWDCINPAIAQEPNKTKAELIYIMAEMTQKGFAKFYREGDSVFFVIRLTPYLAEVHIFSKEKGTKVIVNSKKFLNEFWETTEFKKLQAKVYLKKQYSYLKKVGLEQEGLLKKSFFLNNEMHDEYLFGVTKWVQ